MVLKRALRTLRKLHDPEQNSGKTGEKVEALSHHHFSIRDSVIKSTYEPLTPSKTEET